MTVLEYVQKFLELGRYSPESMVDEGRKTTNFEWGLRLEIRQQLYVFELSTYSAVLTKTVDRKELLHLSSSSGQP